MSFNYEQSLWGKGEANLRWISPTSFRLEQALNVIKDFPQGAVVVEVGTGVGQFIRAIKRIRPELVCSGCDISTEALEQARRYNDRVEYKLNVSESLPYGDNSVDGVVIFDVLEHVEHPEAMIKEIYRILKKDGLLYCFVPCEGDLLSFWNLLDKLHLKNGLTKKYAGHINYFSRRSLKDLFVRNDFKPVSSRYSEHIFGQLVNIAAFLLMHRSACKRQVIQLNNESYFEELKSRQSLPGKIIRDIVNVVIYVESRMLRRVPSPNIHLVLKK